MDDVRIGIRVRAVRHRLRWRQQDVGERAGVSQDTVSRIERGHLDGLQLRTIRAVLRALEVDLNLEARWRGGELDRLADEGHAAIVSRVCAILVDAGWEVRPEVSFAVYGERGSIDVLAWHAASRTLLVVEVKTTLNSIEETLRRHDVKIRLAPDVAAKRLGWRAVRAVGLLALEERSTTRRRVALHESALRPVYAVRGRCVPAWFRSPGPDAGLLWFLSPARGQRGSGRGTGRTRVRRPNPGAGVATHAPGS